MEVTSIDSNEIGVVVRTLTGHAPGVAVYLDGLRMPGVLGTIAGDDTILVLPRTVRRTGKLRRELADILRVI
jgi:transcriptional regulator of arginine metabolism